MCILLVMKMHYVLRNLTSYVLSIAFEFNIPRQVRFIYDIHLFQIMHARFDTSFNISITFKNHEHVLHVDLMVLKWH